MSNQFLEDKIDIQINIFKDIIMQQQEMINKQQELIDHLHEESKTSLKFSIASLTIACISVAVPFVIEIFF